MPLRPNVVFRPSEKWNRCVIIVVLKLNLFLRIFPLNSVCFDGTFGYNCEMSCGSCKNDRVCSKTHGTCPSGCKAGFKLDTCLKGKCSLIFCISSAKKMRHVYSLSCFILCVISLVIIVSNFVI